MKKIFIVGVLFALPIVAYLFFSSGKNNFARLPVLTPEVQDISQFESLAGNKVALEDKITVLAFFGSNLEEIRGNTFNLDQEILDKYYEFEDFQFVILLPEESRSKASDFAREFSAISNSEQWKFVFAAPEEIQHVFNSLGSSYSLDGKSYSPYVFIIDKDAALRGRKDDEDYGKLYGYDSRSVAELNNKMNDDVKVILAEYRLELKKYETEGLED
ncbi:hypothetical protein RM549_05880 [Salegentibacter sp. F188]|uniref:Uncharacterized protein n=1 Tax=Autumnicola patrickiae TaxID=3075591 RepID=A0ABU3E062_9FLAO|nr:hypothetical protein [Salegentibacter sp. F188]MDT0689305.1 hypothetical protein [Salegentibacter sp. F188]